METDGRGMRWESLFADMEAQLLAAQVADLAAEVAERTRAELASVALADRLRGHDGAVITVHLPDGGRVAGRVMDVGPQWVLVGDAHRRDLVPISAVEGVEGLGPAVAPPESTALRRLGLGHVLRAVARDRAVVQVVLRGVTLRGRVHRVLADHVDVAVEQGERPPGGRLDVRAIPFSALLVVRSS